MSSLSEPSTPSPPSRVHTPCTPKFGYGDSWEPFSPRKSSRIAQRASQRTPSPRASSRNRASKRNSSSSSDVFTTTPAASPQKKRQPAMDSVRRAPSALTAEGAANAADSLGIGSSRQKPKSVTTITSAAMLPTPAKTPQKQPDEVTKAKISAVSRNLFSESEIIGTPKKRKTKKYSGITLDSFNAEEIAEPIQIFTDTRDRIPEADKNAQNPFYNQASSSSDHEQPTRHARRRLVSVPDEGKITVEEALAREDGLVYTFRGRKVFRKFPKDGDAQADGSPVRGGTRSDLKPRLLFPSSSKGKAAPKVSIEDEEAVTDIEDHVLPKVEGESAEAPASPTTTTTTAEKVSTPVAPKFAPASPPSTIRATRASTRMQAVGSAAKQSKPRSSPFDGWRRSKSRAATQGQKREGEALAGQDEASKRQRV